MRPGATPPPLGSLRGQLMRWLLLPLAALVVFNAVSVYRYALQAADVAYDRTLLASSRALAERVALVDGRVTVDVSYAALDIFENDTPGRLYYAVTGIHGELVSGYDDLPPLPAGIPRSDAYPALVHFHTGLYHGRPIRIAALYQPVFDDKSHGMALIQVGETMDARQILTRRMLVASVWPQLALVAAVAVLMAVAVRRGLAPLRSLAEDIAEKPPTDLSAFRVDAVHKEVRPLVRAMNHYMDRLAGVLESQRRFVADAAHQLRTPLTLLRTQSEVGLRASDPAELREALLAIHAAVERTSRAANQLLSLARIGHVTPEGFAPVELDRVAREVCLDLGPQAVRKRIDLGYEGDDRALVRGDAHLLRELTTNLLDNAIRYTPEGGAIMVRLEVTGNAVRLCIEDSGPGIPENERSRAVEPFVRLRPPDVAEPGGSGLGLTIVRDIAKAHLAALELAASPLGGLKASVVFAPAGGASTGPDAGGRPDGVPEVQRAAPESNPQDPPSAAG